MDNPQPRILNRLRLRGLMVTGHILHMAQDKVQWLLEREDASYESIYLS